ncbi:MAG: N-acetyl-gamma-glutamyl-phosphate reductase [Candidatus Methanomethylophilaceae archaeon]|jgi:N-acetyl-gamma-glutamyl-phosphate reductase
MTKKAGIIGGTGYTGGELARILCTHPGIEVVAMTSRQSAGKKVSRTHTYLDGYTELDFVESIPEGTDLDMVFVATPHGASMPYTAAYMRTGVKVIDLSGDYRLRQPSEYQKWYGKEHTDAENLANSVYGIPELFRDDIAKAQLVANPGCYPTGTVLAIAPLFKEGVVDTDVIVDAKSGTSGAGMLPSPRTHHPHCGETIIPYGTGTHRHTPEMEMALDMISGKKSKVLFSPHMLPIVRGILSSCYMGLEKDLSEEEMVKMYDKMYGKERFVHVVEEPSIRAVVCSNHCQVAVKRVGDRAVAFGAIDNLVKGASGQAVQCANLMLGLKEEAGLDTPGMGV